MTSDDTIVRQIIKRYGEVINLRESPETIIDILRTFGAKGRRAVPDDGGSPPGGAPPGPPPGPSGFSPGDPTIRDVMKELLTLRKEVERLSKQLGR